MTFDNLVDAVIKISRDKKAPDTTQSAYDCIVRRDIKQVIKDFIFQYIEKI